MMHASKARPSALPAIRVDVVEPRAPSRKGWLRCEIGRNLAFDTAKMESYFFAQWEPVLYDALLLAASVEFCDKTQRRPSAGWGRIIQLRVPVHEPDRWSGAGVIGALHEALDFLTGDRWEVTFYDRRKAQSAPRQGLFSLGAVVDAVIPFSEGLDSHAVAGIMALQLGNRLVRVRLGPKDFGSRKLSARPQAFTSVPYKVRAGEKQFAEPSARSRGFKFALLSGLAAYLANASRIIVPESGQGALGPTLVPVGQAYADYRSHPLFTARMQRFFGALLGCRLRYEFPQLWFTKGETLARFVKECGDGSSSWASTWSCWQQNRHVSVEHRKRQCGICAACMLRRLSVFAAGLEELKTAYVWEDLSAADFEMGAAPAFDRKKITRAMREYAIAGTLHLDHLAEVRRSAANAPALSLSAFHLAQVCGQSEADTRARLDRMLAQHELEWRGFVTSLGRKSSVAAWTAEAQ